VAAKKAGQWRLQTKRCCNHAGFSLISSNSGAATFNGKHKKRTGFGSHPGWRKRQASGGSGRGAAALCGALPRSRQTPKLRTFNGKHKKRTGFGSHPEWRKRQASGRSGRGAAAPCGAESQSRQTPELLTFNGKRKKADRFWFASGKIKTNPSTISHGYVRSSELTRVLRARRTASKCLKRWPCLAMYSHSYNHTSITY
jgi:hypothetical protein